MSRFNFIKFCVVVMAAYLAFGPQSDKSVFTADFMKNQGFGFKQVELRQRVLANADEDQSIPLFREAVKVEEKIVDQVHAQSLASPAPVESHQADNQEFTPAFYSGQIYRLYEVIVVDRETKKTKIIQENENVHLFGEIELYQTSSIEAGIDFSRVDVEENGKNILQIYGGYEDLSGLALFSLSDNFFNLRASNDKKDLHLRIHQGPLKDTILKYSIETKEPKSNERYIANQNVIKQQNTQFSSAPENYSADDQEVSEQSVAF